MNSFTFSYPTRVYFGEGSAAQAFLAVLGKVGKTVMLAYGGGSVKKNGIYDEIKALLEQAEKRCARLFRHYAESNLCKGAGGRGHLCASRMWTLFWLWAAAV